MGEPKRLAFSYNSKNGIATRFIPNGMENSSIKRLISATNVIPANEPSIASFLLLEWLYEEGDRDTSRIE